MIITHAIADVAIHRLRPDKRNPRSHPKAQIEQIAASIGDTRYFNPILIDGERNVIAGHGRLRAARILGMTSVPTITIEGLSDAQRLQLQIADNKIAANAGWDTELLKVRLAELAIANIDLSLTGFSVGEIDALRELKLDLGDPVDPVPLAAVSRTGDIWRCREHRVSCGDLLDGTSLPALMVGEQADMIITDPPYNTSNASHNGGSGRIRHREFRYAHGEMDVTEFTAFLADTEGLLASHAKRSAIAFVFMDHHHAGEQIAAGEAAFHQRLNIAVWVKSNAGMGSLYRSQHEMVFVYKVGDLAHRNNVELGKHGRNRTNVWQGASVNAFGSRQGDLELHPTVKPVGMIADAIMDVTAPGEIVLDGFLGSGTTLLAAERAERRAFGLEIDPAYVDVAITRWMDLIGEEAVLEETGETFSEVKRRRAAENRDA
ncbi:MAG TPA: DNA methyltransferase [Novosphingobium sp.]|nr:DNA methyltransferase [Novosphingobium sp.]